MTYLIDKPEQLENILFIIGPIPSSIKSLAYDSRKVTSSGCFVCIKGQQTDGHDYIQAAIDHGASVIIGTNKEILLEYYYKRPDLTFVLVRNSKKALAQFASTFYKDAHKHTHLIGVTGTNGKTTITAYIRSLLNALGTSTGSIGTAGVWDQHEEITFERSTPTTPESADLHEIFSHLHQKGTTHTVMEATSIALHQERLHGLQFDVAVHSNLSPEHLDYHETMDNYREAKMMLFNQASKAVVNIDDDGMAPDILKSFEGELWTYGLEPDADVFAENIRILESGTAFDLRFQGKTYSVSVPIYGMHNLSNVLAAFTTCLAQGHLPEEIIRACPYIEGPPGRFQIIQAYTGRQMILDFAHTPLSLKTLFKSVESFTYNRMILVITGIGIREPELRPGIARAVEGIADEIIVTVDHPGDENPEQVMNDVVAGFSDKPTHLHLEAKRGKAIHKAMSRACEGDLILITGICMESFQIIQGRRVPYNDLEEIHSYLTKHAFVTPS
ncbi:UDP-N-acetylmuramoyl-L-alanyl-D-glutamate--2,6-diaminopimelate ligase [Bacillus sp. Marseille-P3800]|uniref:UDP-N-acetylmuramoyl-L-alanyl-D-glutamate--2, 6-diaminopimelate ligase n=1 Tax=Bacillus sp. Marseille-P3800 TaxID=2014782 RepID=UPI000C0704CD|nr:UDP-N-acetylmuramoyl-L-alanyl-D-glutamate--2,6-diaminopimelate ligase [Bacillus sp. Marseille-P3800]